MEKYHGTGYDYKEGKSETRRVSYSNSVTKKTYVIHLFCSGLDNAGKSTVLDRWIKGGKERQKICPTFGFEIKTILKSVPDSENPIRLNFWDIGGQKSIRPFWRNYYEETDAIVWVIDSADSDRLGACKEELESVLNADVIRIIFFAIY